jgi:spore germination protein
MLKQENKTQLTLGLICIYLFFSVSMVLPTGAKILELSGWYNDGWESTSHQTYLSHHGLFNEVNPNWYNLGSDDAGPAAAETDGSVFERVYLFDSQKIAQIRAHHTLLIPTLSDHNATASKWGVINRLIAQPLARKKLITTLVQKAQKWHFDGWDLNFEGGLPEGKAAFVAFVRELGLALHQKHMRLSLTLQAVDSIQAESQKVFDYHKLGQLAEIDRFKIMFYDHNFELSPNIPGPIAPIVWMRRSLDYLIYQQKLPAHKIQLGLHNHAWSWCRQADGTYRQKSAQFQTWQELKPALLDLSWDTISQESWLNYAQGRCKAYIGDARTLAKRLELVKTYHLAGVALWVLGNEDPKIYEALLAQTKKP